MIDQRTVGPSLGKDAIQASAPAAHHRLALTALFIILVYRLVGLIAVIGLICYAGMSYAALTALGATLTLPGLAGFVLAIGMAVDANVLVFERASEDYLERPDRRHRRSLRSGFRTPCRRSPTPTSPPSWLPVCCSSWPPARSAASVSPLASV